MSSRASKKQQKLLQFIDDFIKEHGYGPSYREIMRGLGYKSVSTVAVHVEGLLSKGYIRKKDHSARSIEIVTTQIDVKEEKSELVQLLEVEISRRIKEGSVDDVAVLIEAAGVLGSDRTDDLKDEIAKLKK